MNVLSLFDGLSGGQIALDKLGIKVDKYYASEVDKYAITVAMKNYPNTIQIGDVCQVTAPDLEPIDLLIGGSPCQGFSFAGGQLAFDDPRSALFFEYVRLLKELKPKYFLLENVRMKQEFQDIISEYLGVKPIAINSSLLSGQNRPRLYWTNIPNVTQPEDKGIIVRDILEDEVEDKFYLSDKAIDYMGRLRNGKPRWEYHKNPLEGKSACLTANMYKGVPYGVLRLEGLYQVGNLIMKGNESIRRVYSVDGKCPTLTTMGGGHRQPKIAEINGSQAPRPRKLTPLECERLQTLPDNYTEGVSNTRRYQMLGNGWTIDVIAHIFKGMK
jgi:DNA (cytosine-5)-methyltransferase 3A